MRDIRADLKERLADIDRETEELNARLSQLQQHRDAVLVMLSAEESVWNQLATQSVDTDNQTATTSTTVSLRSVLLDVIADGAERSLEQIANLLVLKGFPFGGKSPKRAAHFTLLGMLRGDLVERTANGWRRKSTRAQEILQLADSLGINGGSST